MYKVLYLPEGVYLKNGFSPQVSLYASKEDARLDIEELIRVASTSPRPETVRMIKEHLFEIVEVPDAAIPCD